MANATEVQRIAAIWPDVSLDLLDRPHYIRFLTYLEASSKILSAENNPPFATSNLDETLSLIGRMRVLEEVNNINNPNNTTQQGSLTRNTVLTILAQTPQPGGWRSPTSASIVKSLCFALSLRLCIEVSPARVTRSRIGAVEWHDTSTISEMIKQAFPKSDKLTVRALQQGLVTQVPAPYLSAPQNPPPQNPPPQNPPPQNPPRQNPPRQNPPRQNPAPQNLVPPLNPPQNPTPQNSAPTSNLAPLPNPTPPLNPAPQNRAPQNPVPAPNPALPLNPAPQNPPQNPTLQNLTPTPNLPHPFNPPPATIKSEPVDFRLTLEYLCTYHSFEVLWTDNLKEHLQIQWEGAHESRPRIMIYEHKIFLWNELRFRKYSLLPLNLVEEVLDTLNLLLPFNDYHTAKFLKAQKRHALYSLGWCGRGRLRDLNQYQYFKDRISELSDIVKSTPTGLPQLKLDQGGRNVMDFLNFWVALLVGIFTIFGIAFGTASLVLAKYQYDIAVVQYKLSLAQACVMPNATSLFPQFCPNEVTV